MTYNAKLIIFKSTVEGGNFTEKFQKNIDIYLTFFTPTLKHYAKRAQRTGFEKV